MDPRESPKRVSRIKVVYTRPERDHLQKKRLTLPTQKSEYIYRIVRVGIWPQTYTGSALALSLRLGSRIVPGTPSSLERKLAASDRSFKVPTDESSLINDFDRRSQIRWQPRGVIKSSKPHSRTHIELASDPVW